MKKLIKHILRLKKLLRNDYAIHRSDGKPMEFHEGFMVGHVLEDIDKDIERLCNDSFSKEDEELKELLLLQDPICSKHHG